MRSLSSFEGGAFLVSSNPLGVGKSRLITPLCSNERGTLEYSHQQLAVIQELTKRLHHTAFKFAREIFCGQVLYQQIIVTRVTDVNFLARPEQRIKDLIQLSMSNRDGVCGCNFARHSCLVMDNKCTADGIIPKSPKSNTDTAPSIPTLTNHKLSADGCICNQQSRWRGFRGSVTMFFVPRAQNPEPPWFNTHSSSLQPPTSRCFYAATTQQQEDIQRLKDQRSHEMRIWSHQLENSLSDRKERKSFRSNEHR